jgi:hypothetical protein
MKRKENRKKEKNSEEKWYAWMNELEAHWRTMITESRLEYLESFNQRSKKPSKSKYPGR